MIKSQFNYECSIIVMNKNRIDLLQNCLESIEKYTKDVNYELIIVDALSTDGSRDYLLTNWANKASLIFEKDDTSYAASNNRAMKWCYGKYIYLLNNDCEVTEGWLRNAIDYAEINPDVGHVASLVLWPNGTIMSHGANKLADGGTVVPFAKCLPSEAQNIANYAYAGFGLYRHDLAEKVNYLPEYDTPIYFDDDGYSFAIWSLGYDVRYYPKSVIIHKLYHTERKHHKDADKKGRDGFMAEWGDFLKANNGFTPTYPFTGMRPYRNNEKKIKEDLGNILIFSNVEFVDGGGSKRPANLARAFIKLGYFVTFVNIYPSLETIKLKPIDVDKDINLSYLDLIDINNFDVDEFFSEEGRGKNCKLVINELPHSLVLPILKSIKNKRPGLKIISEIIDNWNTNLGKTWYNENTEREIYKISDIISVTAKSLIDVIKDKTDNKEIIYSPNAVNIDIFNSNKKYDLPEDMPTGKPVVFYMGALWGSWVDYDLIEECIKKYQEYNFVLVGDDICNLKTKWKQYSNCFILGLKPVTEMPNYLQHSSLCIIPFKFDDSNIDIIKHVSPLKLFEYMAMNKKILSTYYEEIADIPNIYFTKNKNEFIKSIKSIINNKSDINYNEFIFNNNWNTRANQLLSIIQSNPLVSIVLPTYNHAKFLERSINSALGQTYNNIELIIVNDGSTDDTIEILDKYKDNPKVKIINHEENKNLPHALNTGFNQANGEFYTWTSADNCMLPSQIEILVRYLQNNTDKGMVYSNYQLIDNLNKPLYGGTCRLHNRNSENSSLVKLPEVITRENFYLSKDNFIGASFLYRKEVAKEIGNYDTSAFGAEDYDYWLRIADKFEIGHCPEVLYRYRVHEDTLNARAKELKIANNVSNILQKNKNFKLKPFKTTALPVSKKIKIVFHLEKFIPGGLEKVVYSLVKSINRDIYEPIVFIEEKDLGYYGKKLSLEGYRVYCLNKNLNTMRKLLDELKPSVVNIHYSWFGLDEYKNRNIKVIYTIHNNYVWLKKETRKYRSLVYRDYMDSFIAVSECVKGYFIKYFSVSGDKINVIPNGLFNEKYSSDQIYTKKSLGFSDEDFIFLTPATFNSIKCQDLIIETMKHFHGSNIKCLLVGGNSADFIYYEKCINKIKQYSLEGNIKVLTNVKPDNMESIYKLSNCLLLPSVTEGWSMSAMEAIYYKLPLILSDVGSAKDILKNNGIMINNIKNIESICSENLYTTLMLAQRSIITLKNAMNNIVNKYNEYKKNAENESFNILNKYSMQNQIKEYEKEIEKCLKLNLNRS